MRKILAVVLMLGLAAAHAADEKKADEKKSSNTKPAQKSDKNVFQKTESSIGKWARENHIWGKPRPGDRQ